jgi:hypothetical protein
MKIVTWKNTDHALLFGEPLSENFVQKNIIPIAHTQDASEYVGISFEEITPEVCVEITSLETDKYYFIYNPQMGYYLTQELISYILKDLRQKELIKITVNIDGIILNGDEDAQNRLSRAFGVMSDIDVVNWKAFDNTFVQLTKDQVKRAIIASGTEQTNLWIKYSL